MAEQSHFEAGLIGTRTTSVPLESILCTEELDRRPSRRPDYEGERNLLIYLSQALADSPRTILQTIADAMLKAFSCDSAGFSLLTKDGRHFYWPALAGAWRPHLGGGMPRDFGPCGDVLDREAPQLFRHCESRYPYLLGVTPHIEECLVVPLYVHGGAVGTIWVIAHTPRRTFDAEDRRQLESLGHFASAACQTIEIVNAAAEQRRAALNLMEDAIHDRQALESSYLELRRAQSESARLAAVVESSIDAIITKDLDGTITSWNAAAERLFGYTADETIGRPVTMLFSPDRLDEEQAVLARIQRGESLDQYETVRRRKDGSLIDISLTVSPIRNRDGRIIGASKIARDITESKQLADRLKQEDRRKNEFLALLAHELRNPLAPILVSFEILRQLETVDASGGQASAASSGGATVVDLHRRRRDALDILQRQVGHMVRLVDDLLDAGRISRGKIELRKENVELAAVVNQAVETVRPLTEGKVQQLTIALPDSPVHVSADPARLAQIVGNLLDNASKFTNPGGQIRLTVEEERGEHPHVLIRVGDNGIGIAEDQLTRVFEMFAQVDTSLERSTSGFGIGLALVKKLTDLHGGSVEARSDGIGRGSEFVVRLPVASGARPSASKPAESRAPGPLRILIVDDNRDAANALGMFLEFSGHEIHTAYDGPGGLEAASRLAPDVILLDIGLPGLNGYEVARSIRQQAERPGRPVLVALTGWGQPDDRRQSREAGFDAHVVKPVNPVMLVKMLAELTQAPVQPR